MKVQAEERRVQILNYIENFTAEHRCPPTIREIQRHFNIRSTSTVYDDLIRLEQAALIGKCGDRFVPKYTKSFVGKITENIKNAQNA